MQTLGSALRVLGFATLVTMAAANDWNLIFHLLGPAARSGHTMVWDPGADGGGFWMFGGELLLSIKTDDLYFYSVSSNSWTQKASGPAARYRHSAVFDPTARAMYVFAGTNLASAGNTFSDLHRYDVALNSWTELQGTAGRSRHTAVWDSSLDRMIVFGGLDNMLNKMGDILEYDRSSDSWSFPSAEGPAAREGHVAVWDAAAGTMLMCCGLTASGDSGELWTYDGTWTMLSPSGSITARRYASAVWDPQARAMLGFGGSEGSRLNSLFLYSTTDNSWSQYTESGPPAQDRGAAVWDPVNSHLYTFGGVQLLGLLDDLWRLDASHTSITSTTSSTSATSSSTTTYTTSATRSATTTYTTSSTSSVTSSSTGTSTSTSTLTDSTTETTVTLSSTSTRTSSSTSVSSSSTTASMTSSTRSTISSTSTSSISVTSTSVTTSLTSSTATTVTTTSETSTRTTATVTTITQTSSTATTSTATTSTATSVTSSSTSLTSSTSTATSATSTSTSLTHSSTMTSTVTATSTSSSSASETGTTTTSVTSSSSTASTSTSATSSTSSFTVTRTSTSATSSSTVTGTSTSATLSSTVTSTSTSATSSSSSTTTVVSATTSTKTRTTTGTSTWASQTTTWTKVLPTTSTTGTQFSPTAIAGLLLDDLDSSESELARQLIAALTNSSNSGILGSTLNQSDLATIQTLALDSPTISEMNRTITVQSTSARVEVPSDVVAQAAAAGDSGLVLLSVSVGLGELGAELNGTKGGGRALVSRPVSITFRGPDGQRLPMPSLARPIEVLLLGAREGSRCGFWEEETGTWSSQGLREISFRDGELLCQTSHLTVFGAVLEAFLQVLRCSTATQVFSAEGFENLSKGTWPGHAHAVITFSALFICLLLLLYALRLDRRRSLSRKQVEAALLIELEVEEQELADDCEGEDEEIEVEKKVRQPSVCRQAASWLVSNFAWFLSQMFEVPDADVLTELMNARVVTVNRCISSLHSYKSHADRQSIRAAETSVGHAHMRHSTTAGVSVTVEDFVRMDETFAHNKGKSLAAMDFLSSRWCKRVVLLTRAMHPWVTMQFVSLFRSHAVRASLIILKLVSAAAANALFFSSSAVSADSDMDCGPPQTPGERLLRATIVGVLSACMGDLLIVLLAMVQRRQVLIRHWTEEAKERQLRRWRCRRHLFWLLWFLDVGISILYVCGFLANVSQADGAKWIESTAMSLLQDLVLKPLYLALVYGTVASLVLCCSPSVGQKILAQWGLQDDDNPNRDDSEATQARPESHALRPVCEEEDEIHEVYVDYL